MSLNPGRSSASAPRQKVAVVALLLALLLAVCVSGLLKPLTDFDFFWHLKSGEWIWQHKSLISGEDPFCYTAPSSLDAAHRFVLNGYWLSQVILHLIERAAGLGGIVAWNVLLCSLLLWAMWWRREGEVPAYCALLVLMAVVIVMFPFERPQIYSFLCFAILLRLLATISSSIRTGAVPARGIAACALLMAIWANLHPGFIVGIAAIGLSGVEALTRRALGKAGAAERRLFPLLAGALAAAILVTLLNPNGWQVFRHFGGHFGDSNVLTSSVLEYQSSVYWYRTMDAQQMLVYWFILAVTALAAALRPREVRLPEAALLLGIGYLSFAHIRHLPFFLVVALPVAGRGLSGAPPGTWVRGAVVVAALISGTYTMITWKPQIRPLLERRWVNDYTLPVDAASFILQADLKGRMYNHFGWGGYLSWRLGPERKVFIDGRVGVARARLQAFDLDAGRSDFVGGRPFWNRVFDEWGVSWVITPAFDWVGNLTPLPLQLQSDTEWEPVFLGGNAVVFVRRSMENARTIERYALGRANLARYFLSMVDQTLATVPRHVRLLIARGDLLLILGRDQEAREAYGRAAQADPGNPLPHQRPRAAPEGPRAE